MPISRTGCENQAVLTAARTAEEGALEVVDQHFRLDQAAAQGDSGLVAVEDEEVLALPWTPSRPFRERALDSHRPFHALILPNVGFPIRD
ncbi:MAG: hypothetical protein Kilf2KO_01980 [Rhodospirillales bacterium]